MKHLNFLIILMILMIASGLVAGSAGLASPLLDKGSDQRCEKLLGQVRSTRTTDELLNAIDQIENELITIGAQYPAADLTRAKRMLEKLTNLSLEGRNANDLRPKLEILLLHIRSLAVPDQTAASLMLADYIYDHAGLRPDVTYQSANSMVRAVRFEDAVLAELNEFTDDRPGRFLRAIERGFVGAHSGGGIVRMPDVHRKFFEIKMVGFGHVERLLGCLEDGVLVVKRLYVKRNEGASGSLQRYAGLCRESAARP